MNPEGIIKFNCNWIKEKPLYYECISELNAWRDRLYEAGLIGLDKDHIGYGNISIRSRSDTFIITGSGTGKFKKLTNEHYTQVTAYNFDQNMLTAKGPILASSESLTHAMIYECAHDINAVMHVHHLDLWKKLSNTHYATNEYIAYGTIAMAREISRLFKETDIYEQKIFAMKGHEAGIISFGTDLSEAGQVIFNKLVNV